MTTFTSSLPRRPDITGSPEQVFRYDNFVSALISGIDNGIIAAIGTIDLGSQCLQYLFHLKLHRRLDGTVSAIIGNSSNIIGEFSVRKVEISSLRLFPVVDLRGSFPTSLTLGADIPANLRTDTWLAQEGEPVAGCVLPNFFPVYFGQDIVYGDTRTDAVVEAFAQLGIGYEVWLNQAMLANERLNDIIHIVETLEADKSTYFDPSWIEASSPPFASNGPCGTSIIVQSSEYPQEAHAIKSFFVPTVAPPLAVQPPQGNIIVTLPGEAEKDAEAKNGITKLSLFFIAADCDFDTGTISNIQMATRSPGMDSVVAAGRAARAQYYSDLIRKACNSAREQSPWDARGSQVSLKIVQKTVAAGLLSGNFATEQLTSFYNEANSVDPSVFLPQTNAVQLASIQETELKLRNEVMMEVADTQRTKPKTAIARIGSLSSMEAFSSTCININTIISASISAASPVPVLRQVVMGMAELVNNADWKDYWARVGTEMPEFHLQCYGYLDTMWNNLAHFAVDFNNCNVINENRPLVDLDLSKLRNVVKAFKGFRYTLSMAQATNAPITAVPQYLKTALALTASSKKRDSDAAAASKPASASNAKSAKSGSPTQAAAAANEAQPKKRKQGPRGDTEPPAKSDRGMFFLKDPNMELGKIFPSDLSEKLCAGFMCKGKECTRPRGQCAFKHRAKPSELAPADLNAIIAKFRAEGTGWLNKHVFGDVDLNPCQALMLGDANGFGQSVPIVAKQQPSPAITFEEELDSRLHSNLVIRSKSRRSQPSSSTLPSSLTAPATSFTATTAIVPTSNASVAVSTLATSSVSRDPSEPPQLVKLSLPSSSAPLSKVGRQREKKRILEDYQTQFGSTNQDATPIVSCKKGKRDVSSPLSDGLRPCMKPELNKSYRVDDLNIYHVIAIVLNEHFVSFTSNDVSKLRSVDKTFHELLPKIARWRLIDFSSLREPRLNYESQTSIDPQRVEMASAAMLHFGLHPGKFVRWMGGEYIGRSRNVSRVLTAVKDHISENDFFHVRRILLQGCPHKLQFEESCASKHATMKRGNQKNFIDNPEIVRKTLNKEDRYSHLIPMDRILCLLSPYLRHTSQGIILKAGKNARVVWDGSTKRTPLDVVLNELTSILDEAAITFGNTKMLFYIDVYNLRISYPDKPILLALADKKACFRFGRVHPDLTGAFGFYADDYYCLATAMVFGSNTSATSWEPFRRSIEALSLHYANRPDLVIKHKRYLDMIQWAPTTPSRGDTKPVRAHPCALNRGLLDSTGKPIPRPARIYVDDALLAAVGRKAMELALAAIIEAIFVVMGDDNPAIRQCPLAMDKWESLVVGTRQTILGVVLDTHTMAVSMTPEYIAELRALLDTTWHGGRKRFTVSEAQSLTGKLARLAEGAHWVFHLISHLYTSIAYALSENKKLLSESSEEFQTIVADIKSGKYNTYGEDQAKHISFALKRAAHLVHHAKFQYNINSTMRAEIDFFREQLHPASGTLWSTPLALIVPRDPFATAFGDACLHGAGGYSLSLGFWWHLDFPDEVKQRTLLYMHADSDDSLISINVLEFVTVILNYCAILHVVTTTDVTDDPHPVVLNVTDNTSALNWTLHACKTSRIGRLLARVFCSFLINSPVGITSKWISTHENDIADDISRQKQIPRAENLLFLPLLARSSLVDLGDRVDREMALSQHDKAIETQAARQAHYIKWCTSHHIPDPCGFDIGYERIVAMYLKDVMLGNNFNDMEELRAMSVRGYAEAVNILFQKRGFVMPVRWSEPGNLPAILVDNLAKEEDVASQRSPLDNKIFAQLHAKAAASKSPDSLDNVFFNLLVLARYVGPRSSEYAQTKQSVCDYHTYPSGRKVVKAFTANDFAFYDDEGNRITDLSESSRGRARSVRITWRIQKNRKNGQKITLGADTKVPILCPVRSCMKLVERALRLGQSPDLPVCVYPNKNGQLLYLTGSKVASLLRHAVMHIRPTTPKDELTKYSAHSLRVWACVLLDEAGKSPDFIKKRLRWMGDSFRIYLRDTAIINQQHRDALASASSETSDFISEAIAASMANLRVADSALPDDAPVDQNMGSYKDDMD